MPLLTGKMRLLLVGAAVAAIVVIFVLFSSRGSSGGSALKSTPTATAVLVSGPTATPEQLAILQTWTLTPDQLPAGTALLYGPEQTSNAVAGNNDPKRIQQWVQAGRITGFIESWHQGTAQEDFQNNVDLYRTAAQAQAQMNKPPTLPAGATMQNLPSPHLGDASRMYSFAIDPPGGPQQTAFLVTWTRGPVLLLVSAGGPPGELTQAQVLAIAKSEDAKAAANPLK